MTAEEIRQACYLQPTDSESLVFEKLICLSLLQEDTKITSRVLDRFIRWRDILKAAAVLPPTNGKVGGETQIIPCVSEPPSNGFKI